MTKSISESENPAIPSPKPKASRPRSNRDWWPNQLDLQVLHQHAPGANPMGPGFDYAKAFASLDVSALKQDLLAFAGNGRARVGTESSPNARAP